MQTPRIAPGRPGGVNTSPMSGFIGYPRRKVLSVFDDRDAADRAIAGLEAAGIPPASVERFEGPADADRFDSTGARHGIVARATRAVQFSLMDQLPALAWYEAALRDGRSVLAIPTRDRAETLRVVRVFSEAGGHFINRFGRLATEEFARWRGPEPPVASVMKH